MDTNYIIETKNLTKQYGSQKSVADLNIHVKRGRIYGLLGRNGAGKTTTMKMLLGLTKPTSGEVKIWGKSLQGNEKKLLPRIGSLIESPGFYPNLTGTENLRIFATLRGVPNNHAIKDALDLVGLPYKDKKLFSQYSLGMKQRLAIALAVMHDPELLILDEPINGLDPIGIAEVRSFIRELCDARGKTILISSHILSEISLLADDIGIIDHGALLEEESLAELEQKSSKHIRFTLSDTAQAARILERNFHENHFSIQDDHNLRLHNLDLPVGKIVTAFVENGLEVSEVHTCEESLEDYFKHVTGEKELLKLIKCEFLKLKRKKFIPLIILAAFLFPIPLTYLMTTPSMIERYTDRADAFDGLFNMVLGYGIQFLLPCIIGVIAAILFFMERDNDTFKNLRTIPVTSTQMVLAKIIVLFIFGIVFCVASTIATILCGIGTLEVYGIGYKLFLAVETGIFITAGTLPLIVLVVFFSKTYVFSILLCVFYSVLNMSATALFDTLPKTMLWLLPTPLTTFWSAGDMAAHGIKMDLEQMTGLIPSTFQVVFILGIMALVSFLLIDRLYKQRGNKHGSHCKNRIL